MRETRLSGLEGGGAALPLSLPLSNKGHAIQHYVAFAFHPIVIAPGEIGHVRARPGSANLGKTSRSLGKLHGSLRTRVAQVIETTILRTAKKIRNAIAVPIHDA